MAVLMYAIFGLTVALAGMVCWSYATVRARQLSPSSPRRPSRPGAVAVVSVWCGATPNPFVRHRASRRCYTRRHGYEYVEDGALCESAARAGLRPHYSKVLGLQQLLARYDALAWMDADAIVGKYDFSLERLLKHYPRASLIIPSYYPSLGGPFGNWFFLLRNTTFGHAFLHRWFAMCHKYSSCYLDQSAMLMTIVQLLTEHLVRDPAARAKRLARSECAREADRDGLPCKTHRGEALWWAFQKDLLALGVPKMWAAMARGKPLDLPVAQLPYRLGWTIVTAGYLPPHAPADMPRTFLAHFKASGLHADAFFAAGEWPPPCNASH